MPIHASTPKKDQAKIRKGHQTYVKMAHVLNHDKDQLSPHIIHLSLKSEDWVTFSLVFPQLLKPDELFQHNARIYYGLQLEIQNRQVPIALSFSISKIVECSLFQ